MNVKKLLIIPIVFICLEVLAMTPVDFKALTLPTSPNQYLVCPEHYCNVSPSAISPAFAVPVKQLQAITEKTLHEQPRVTLLYKSEDGLHQQYRQRSLIFRFPDYIDIRFIALDNNHATLAIYSRSRYGHSDFGVNKKRVEMWLQQLQQRLTQ